MSATPADIAKYTQDGIVVSTSNVTGAAIKAAHPEARDLGDSEIEMFFTSAAHAQALLDERFTYLGQIHPLHEAVEVEESLGIGTTIPLAPTVPSFRLIDDERGINRIGRTRAIAHDLGTDRFSIEVMS